jgi:cobalt/nickel transport system ATP-binding protein
MTEPIFDIQGVEFRYPGGEPALQEFSLSITRGERTAVLGRNGAGKSTLFSLLNGIQKPHRGQVLFAGQPIRYDRRSLHELRRRVGIVFQDPDSQLFSASVREDVSFGPMNLGLPREEVLQRVERALEAVGLAGMTDRPTHALSHGQKKRVCIAGVLAMEPEIIILDEPTAGLDSAMTRELLTLLDELHRKGLTLILATHDVNLAYGWADDICILDGGRLAFQGNAKTFVAHGYRLPDLGLERPWVMDIYAQLQKGGLLQNESVLPRSKSDLLDLLDRKTPGGTK